MEAILIVIIFIINHFFSTTDSMSIFPSDISKHLKTPDLFNTANLNINEIVRKFPHLPVDPHEVGFLQYIPNENTGIFEFISPEQLNLCKPTKIFLHGWYNVAPTECIGNLAKAYMKKYDCNFVSVYWDVALNDYLQAVTKLKTVGKYLGQLIIKATNGNLNLLKNVHILGQSLGAHVIGLAGKEIYLQTGGIKVAHITGLDAAAPLFEYPSLVSADSRLSSGDADFVDAIHTCIGSIGFTSAFADVDYYINGGGPIQPECNVGPLAVKLSCSHNSALDFLRKAIEFSATSRETICSKWTATLCQNRDLYQSGKCDGNDKINLGTETMPRHKGSYYLVT